MVPQKVKREAVELLLLKSRASEELELIPEEMSNIMIHHLEQHAAVTTALARTTGDTLRQIGRRAFLKRKANQLAHRLRELQGSFSPYSQDVQHMQLPETVQLNTDEPPCPSLQQDPDNEYLDMVMAQSDAEHSDSDNDGAESDAN